ncbi:MAG TPA: type 4a pilus biogenesis protein PilO [Candidatus Methylomirabilis sp.]|nr:type 4a pilus biogenesis protein PilO [Candidatus Methylomirabilis sp.]
MAALRSIDWSAHIAGVSLRLRVALGVLFVLLVSVAYWQFFLRSNWSELDQARGELFRLHAEAARTRRIASQRPLLEHELKLLEARLSRAVIQLPKEKEIPSLLTRVARLGRETDLDVSLFRPGPPVSRGFYTEVPVQLKVIGVYHNLGVLFERLGRMDRIVNVADLTIRPSRKDQKASASIEAEVGVVTYTYTGSQGAKNSGPAKTGT